MRIRHLERTQVVAAPLDDSLDVLCRPANLEAITPAWLGFRIDSAPAELGRGDVPALPPRPLRRARSLDDGDRAVASAPLVRRRAAERPVPALGAHAPALRGPGRHRDPRPVRYRVPGGPSRRSSTASSGRCWRRSSTTAPDGQPSCCRRRRGDASGADRARGSCRATRPARGRRWCARARCAPDRRRVRARSRSG